MIGIRDLEDAKVVYYKIGKEYLDKVEELRSLGELRSAVQNHKDKFEGSDTYVGGTEVYLNELSDTIEDKRRQMNTFYRYNKRLKADLESLGEVLD